MHEILYYETQRGDRPVEEFISGLNYKTRQKFYTKTLTMLASMGIKTPMSHAKPLKGGIYELRVRYASDEIRVLYYFCHKEYIVLTNAFRKTTSKTPPREIEKALIRKKDFEERVERGEIKL